MKELFEKKSVADQVAELKACDTTIKEAGFNSVWGAFIEDFYENGLELAKRKVSILEKRASADPFIEGQNQAVDFISNVNGLDINYTVKQNWEIKNMNSFEMGKEAAYNDMIEMAESGATPQDIITRIRETFEQDLEKSASAEDQNARLGVETACYTFLKCAGEVYGEYEIEDGQEDLVLATIFEKVAKDGAMVHVPGGRKEYAAENLKNRLEAVGNLGSSAHRAGVQYGKHLKNKKIMMGAAGAGLGAAALGGAAYALKRRSDAKKNEEGGQKKKASDEQVELAIQILEEAGYEFS